MAREVVNSTSNQEIARAEPSSSDALQIEEYRKLLRVHLEPPRALFRRLTGLEASVAWAPTWPHCWDQQDLPLHSGVCRKITTGNPAVRARCQSCGSKHLALTLEAGQNGHHFLCHQDVRNFWFPIIVRRCAIGIAFVQALDRGVGRGQAGQATARISRPAPSRPGRPARQHPAGKEPMTPSKFQQIAKLLQLILQHAQTSALADLRKKDLTQARQALLEFQTVATRLREELNGLVPAFNKAAPELQPENRTEQIVHAAMDYIHRHYAQPMTLQGCADALCLNAAYLSTLFARTVGLSFKTYLTDVRLEKARRLLNDPTKNIAEVASAVGYGSENRFRIAFKNVTGLAPKLWRETLRTPPLVLVMWFFDITDLGESLGFSFLF